MQLRGLPPVGLRRLDRAHRQDIKEAAPNTRWLVGTELNLVNRLAEEVKPEGKIVQFMAPTVCMCSTMQRIDPQHLAWTLENLADGNVVNRSACRNTKRNSPDSPWRRCSPRRERRL